MGVICPEIRQYMLEGNDEELPFYRAQRSIVYQRAKNQPAEIAVGTLTDVYRPGLEFISHSMLPADACDPRDFRVFPNPRVPGISGAVG